MARGLSSCGSQALGARASVVVAHGLSCSTACRDLPRPGLEPVSPVLAGGFLTTATPGKSQRQDLISSIRLTAVSQVVCTVSGNTGRDP